MGRTACFLLLLTFVTGLIGVSAKGGHGRYAPRYPTYSRNTGYGYYGQSDGNRTPKPEQGDSEPEVRHSNTGLSAWGIVAVVISIIMLSIIAYYFAIFYPMFCKKERKYDIIELEKV